jgi:hypothetical protein
VRLIGGHGRVDGTTYVRKFSKSFRIVVKVSISTGRGSVELRTAVQLYKDHEGRRVFQSRRGRSCRLMFAIIRFLVRVTY